MSLLATNDVLTLDRLIFERVIAVATGKGGVGKTSIVTNLAGLLAAAGFKVLIQDFDPQANVNEDLGITNGDDGMGAFNSIATGQPLVPLKDVRPGLDVVTSGEYISDLASTLDGRRSRIGEEAVMNSLAVSLAPIVGEYDFVFIDTNPGIVMLQDLALATARWLLVPRKSDESSRKAVQLIGRRFIRARQYNEALDLLGVVLFGSTSTATALRQQILNEIHEDLEGTRAHPFAAVIRHVERSASQARKRGQLIHELEVARTQQTPWWELLRAQAEGAEPSAAEDQVAQSVEDQVAQSVTNLAGDYQQLTNEVVEFINASEQGTTDTERQDG